MIAPIRRAGLKDELLAYVDRYPKATPRQIAKALNCREEYVRATASRQGIKLKVRAKKKAGANSQATVSKPRVRIKEFHGTPEQYDALARKVSLIDLGPRDCKWPVGDLRDADFGFCGHVRTPGKPYCAYHQKRSEGPGTRGERAATSIKRVAA